MTHPITQPDCLYCGWKRASVPAGHEPVCQTPIGSLTGRVRPEGHEFPPYSHLTLCEHCGETITRMVDAETVLRHDRGNGRSIITITNTPSCEDSWYHVGAMIELPEGYDLVDVQTDPASCTRHIVEIIRA